MEENKGSGKGFTIMILLDNEEEWDQSLVVLGLKENVTCRLYCLHIQILRLCIEAGLSRMLMNS